MRGGGLGALVVCVACSADVTLPLDLPAEAVTLGLVVDRSGTRTLTMQPVGAPLPALRAESDERLSLALLTWREPIEALGALRLAPPDGEPAPPPLAGYRADLDASAWTELPIGDALLPTVVRAGEDVCARVELEQETLPVAADGADVVGFLTVALNRVVVVLRASMLVAASTGFTTIEAPVTGMEAVASAPDTTMWVATASATWRGVWNGTGVTLSLESTHEVRKPIALAAGDDEILELSGDGQLRRYADRVWTELHRFQVPAQEVARGTVTRIGPRAFAAGVATDPVIFRWEDGQGRTQRLQDRSEGALSFAVLPDLGLVAATSLGHLTAESRGFEVLPDPRGGVPLGTDISVLAPLDDNLLIAGELGYIGMLGPGREPCRVRDAGGAHLRFWAPFGDGLLLAGPTRAGEQAAVTQVQLFRAPR